jgi:hypothetical protein
MNDSTRGYKIVIAVLAAALLVAFGVAFTRKGGGADDEAAAARLNKLASDFEECKTQRADLKEKLKQAEVALAKAQQAPAANVAVVDPITGSAKPQGGGGGPPLPMEQVMKVINQSRGGLRVCYERALKRNTGLQMQPIRVTFNFNIHPQGTPGETQLEADTHIDAQLVDCFKQAIGRWRFPAFGGEPMPIQLPQAFQPIGK